MVVRQMRVDDAAVAAALEKKIFPDAWGEKGIAEELSDEFYRGYIVCVDPDESGDDSSILADGESLQGAAGYVLVRTVAGEGEILRVGVLPGFRRRGLAKRMLEEVFGESDRYVEQWFLEVREHNTAAIGLYRSFGFFEVGRRKAYYQDTKEAAVLMRRDVHNTESCHDV